MMTRHSSDAALIRIASTFCWVLMLLYSPVTMVRAADIAELSAQSQMDEWIPNAAAFDNSSIVWSLPLLSRQNVSGVPATVKSKMQFGRTFHDSRLDNGAAFDFDNDNYKTAVLPFDPNGSPAIPAPGSVHFHTFLKPPPVGSASASSSSSGLPFGVTTTNVLHSYQQNLHSDSSGESDYHYPAPQYLPSLPSSQYLPAPPVHNIEVASEHHGPEHYYYYQQQHRHPSTQNSTSHQLELNSPNRLFVQPGKCSNSVEVGRVRDVQVRTALRSGTDAQKGVCVLMLYTPNQLNKLAISLQAVHGTTNFIPTGTWLETNVKVYALQAGDIQPIFTK